MRLKRILALSTAAVLVAAMLTGCPWEPDAPAPSEPSSSSSSSSRPSHDDEDDTDTPDEPDEPDKPDEPSEPGKDPETPENPDEGGEDDEPVPTEPTATLENGTLTITGGSGSLEKYMFNRLLPGEDITTITELDLSGSGYTSIGNKAFSGWTNLESIKLPKGLESIGTGAFQSCLDLTSVTLLEGLETIGTGAFQFCGSLESVDLPSTLTTIEDSAFHGCSELTSIKLPNTLTKLGTGAFMSCTKLTNIYVGDGILKAEIGGNAFDGVGGLEEEPITVTVYYPSEWREESDNSNLNNLKTKLNFGIGVTVDYVPYDELTQTTSELPDGAKGLLEMARLFGL